MSSTLNAATSGGLTITSDTSGILKLQTAGTDAVTITAAQNVGIGATPSAWGSSYKALEVGGVVSYFSSANQYFGMYANAYRNSGGSYVYTTTGVSTGYIQDLGAHKWYNAASGTAGATVSFTQAMTLDASGNLGIGTSSPTAKVTVYNSGSGDAAVRVGNAQNGITTDVGKQGATGYGATSAGDAFLYSGGTLSIMADNASSVIKFSAGSNTERARIDSSGNLLVGTTSVGGVGISNYISVGNGGYAIYNQNYGNGWTQISFRYSGTQVGQVTTNTSSTSYATSSDYRLKENIAPMESALATVAQLKPVTYTWKADGSAGQGFIAHELQEVVPDAVVGEKDATRMEQYEITPAVPATYDEEGNELTPAVEAVMGEREVPVYQGIDTSFLVATLTAAIKEMKEIIDQQSERITALEGAAQ